ncbi:MAG: type I-E CRISPR-associated protein Cse2/CasB [Hyphomonadaceae bacterium]|nr:type I-E CRISPR-associated protein Cse2/CasB [Hyphomonadaceae bacterium]
MMGEATKINVAKIASDWWKQCCSLKNPAGHGGARQFRAACRRLRSPMEAYRLEQTILLHRELAKAAYLRGDEPDSRVGLIAGLLGQVECIEADGPEKSFAAFLMGKGDPPKVSPMRFQKLVRANVGELMTPLRRTLAQIEFRCDPGRLASDLFFWGDDVKARWCLQYYGDTQPPHLSNTASEETPA